MTERDEQNKNGKKRLKNCNNADNDSGNITIDKYLTIVYNNITVRKF